MRVAMIGLGRWGKILLGELEKQAEVKYKCDSKSDLNTVFSDPEIQTVFIATPTEKHFDIAKNALEAGKNVFLEKPGTSSSTDLEKLVKLSKESGVKLAIGYEFIHHPVAQKLKALIDLDKVRSIALEWQKWGTFKDDAIKHLLCHEISILKFLGFQSISPSEHKHTRVISETDIIRTEFDNEKNIPITSLINRVCPIKQKTVTIITDNGGYIWSNNELFSINTETQALDKAEVSLETPVSLEIKDFLNSIEENREPLSSGQFALDVYKIIEQVK